MDAFTREYYELRFKVAFMERKADEFQDFFCNIMELGYPADFIRVRPWGKLGDWKNDGYLRSKRILFQSYAPNEISSAACLTKVDEDFLEALPHWKEHFGTWVFVHNSREGLGPEVTKKLLDLQKANSPLLVTQWGFPELRSEAMGLALEALASLLGPMPSRQGMVGLGLQDLIPVLDQIGRMPPMEAPDLRPVPADKLQRNLLSGTVEELLRLGMSRSDLVRKYFSLKPTLQDQIAESFRIRYRDVRATAATPDDIFVALQKFAGGDFIPSPPHQNAVLAVVAFFFEECDIFERPEPRSQS